MKNKIYHRISHVLLVLIFVALLFIIDNRYDKELPNTFWFIIYLVHWVFSYIIFKQNKKNVIFVSLLMIIIFQICLLVFPNFYFTLYSLINKFCFTLTGASTTGGLVGGFAGAKAGAAIGAGFGFLGPIGFAFSTTYFVVDAAGGFGDFGEIKP